MKLENTPAFYFPLTNGRYEVQAGLNRLEKDFGNGQTDQHVFQFDSTFQDYRDNKLACRRERLSKFYIEKDFANSARRHVNEFLVTQLCREHPDKFAKQQDNTHIYIDCLLTKEKLVFDKNYCLLKSQDSKIDTAYTSGLDALACQFQEDISIVQLTADDLDVVAALHLCSPNHWAAEDKIGKSFIGVHKSIPHMETLNQQSPKLLQSLIEHNTYVRFAWGLATDNRLNHHPLAPAQHNQAGWAGRQFDPNRPELWLRIERQTLTGIKENNMLIFTIRTYFYDVKQVKLDIEKQEQLISAIQSMSNESLTYKGFEASKVDILNWLESAN